MVFLVNQGTLVLAILTISFTVVARFLYTAYVWRRHASKLPGPPHHPIWGHLHLMGDLLRSQPRNIALQTLPLVMKHRYNLPDTFYIDVWPMGPPMLVCTHPDTAIQFTAKQYLPKHPAVASFTKAFTDGSDMVAADGPKWKVWRSAFNPGFSASHLMTLMPKIVDDVATYSRILKDHAVQNDLFRMEHLATRLTIDIIGKVVLDDHFNSQLTEHELVTAFESQVTWIPVGVMNRPAELINIFRPFVIWRNKRRMDSYVAKKLEERFATRNSRGKTKYVIDLALETYLKERGSAVKDATTLDPAFKEAAITNMKIFIFAGHDTSSSAICYCFYHLSLDPDALALLRKECDDIFGTDLRKTGEKIKEDPYLLNKMEYGMAVIREVLRLHPPANAVRSGSRDFFITDPETGERYPTDGWMLFAQNVGLHYNPRVWGEDVMTFRPSRWLTPSIPPFDAWVPFSKGVRNCIGQELALLELRMVLAMTVREFDFKEGYEEVGSLKGDGSGYPSETTGVQEQFGEKAYQIQLGTAKPREGMPCRLSVAQR